MGSAGNATENLILDAMFGDDRASSMPSTIYFALYIVAPGDAGGGTEVGASATAYARVDMPNDNTTWEVASAAEKVNAVDITWDEATDDWGTIVAWAIHSTGVEGLGEPMVWGALASPIPITTGMTPFFAAGNFKVFAD